MVIVFNLLFGIATKTIYIYSDKIRSGKTTRLFAWADDHRDVAGILPQT